MKIKLGKCESEEFLNKIGILLDEPELISNYGLSSNDVEEIKSIYVEVYKNSYLNKDVEIELNTSTVSEAIRNEMLDAAKILYDQIDEEMTRGEKIAHSRLAGSIKNKFSLKAE